MRRHPERFPRGEAHVLAKVTDAAVRAIRERYAQGDISQAALAREYGICQMTVSRIVRKRIWKHVA